MKSVYPATAADPGYVHPDGAIRCPSAFHSVLPADADLVEFRIRALVRGDQVTGIPVDAILDAFRAALAEAGFEAAESDAGFRPPAHDCEAMRRAALPEGT